MRKLRIDPDDLALLVIDVQPYFLDYAFPENERGRESLLIRLEHLLLLAGWLDLPLIATFEIPLDQNGELPERLERVFPKSGLRFPKNYFGVTGEKAILQSIQDADNKQIALAGAETDVCILQSALGLLELGYQVFLLEDCLFTTEPHPGPALRRMIQAGAVPLTLKSLAYELVRCVEEIPWYPEYYQQRDHPGKKPFPEEFIPPEEWPEWDPKLE